MKVGSLVNFHTTVNAWTLDYVPRNPGIVLSVKEFKPGLDRFAKASAKVLWSNGEVTNEHQSFLEIITQCDEGPSS
jgi:hypothetical protein